MTVTNCASAAAGLGSSGAGTDDNTARMGIGETMSKSKHQLEAERCRRLLEALANEPAIRVEVTFLDGGSTIVVTATGDHANEEIVGEAVAQQWALLFPSVATKGVQFRAAAIALAKTSQATPGDWPELDALVALGDSFQYS